METEHPDTGEDYGPIPPSKREVIAKQLRSVLVLLPGQKILVKAVRREEDGKCYLMDFSTAEPAAGQPAVYGEIRVYQTDYFVVIWNTSERGVLETHGSRLLDTIEKVAAFIRLAFVESKPQDALAIPERVPKRPARRQKEVQASDHSTSLPIQEGMFGTGNA